MRTKTRGGRARIPKLASPSSTTQSLHFFNHDLDGANGESCMGMMDFGASSEMNDDVDPASAYIDDETRIPVEKHGGDCMDVDLLEEDSCIKCSRRDGNLLICSQSGCPVSVHTNCMKCALKFDEVGNFYCPYCWYKRVMMRSKELRKKAMETKKVLANFFESKMVGGDKEENSRSDKGKELNMSSLGGESNYVDGDSEDRMDSNQVENRSLEVEEELKKNGVNAKPADSLDQFKTALENQSDLLAPIFHPSDNINHGKGKRPRVESLVNSTSKERFNEENVSGTHELEFVEDGETTQVEHLGQVDDSGHEKIVKDQLQEVPHWAFCAEEENDVDGSLNILKVDILDDVKVKEGRQDEEEKIATRTMGSEMSDSDNEPISMHLKRVAGSSKKAQYWSVDSPKKLSPKGADPEKIARTQNEKATASKKSTRVSGGKFTNFTFAFEIHRRSHWTAEEEEMLKEGVQNFSTKVNKNLPWRKVLEYGRHVFEPTRTPSDLKDKWRKIVAKESSGIGSR